MPSGGSRVVSAVGCPGALAGNTFELGPLSTACTLSVQFGAGSVVFEDANLEAAVRKTLGLTSASVISAANLSALTTLNVFESGVNSLSGLESAINLRSLDLTGNTLTDLSPLSGLTKLTTLKLANTPVSDLKPLRSLPISSLNLSASAVVDLSEIPSLKKLSLLYLAGTRVIDLEPLRRSSLGPGDTLDLGTSSEGCLYTAGYSRPLVDISYLRDLGVRVQFIDERLRNTGCPNSIAQTNVSLNAELTAPTDLSVTWSFVSADTGAWRCELHPDLTFQQPAEPLARIDNCPRESSLAMDFSGIQTPKMFVVEDGLGGRLTRTLMPTRGANAGPAATVSIVGFDFGQSVIKSNPRLVANREALVRVHVVADQSQVAPNGTLTLHLGEQSQVINLTKPTNLPTLLQLTNLTRSYSAVIPANWVQPGLSLQVQLANGLSKTLLPVVGTGTVFYLTLVPITSAGTSPQMPTSAAVERNLKTIWPLAQVVVRTHEPIDLDFNAPDEGLAQLADIKAREGDTSYVFGLLSPAAPNFNVGGLAYVGGKVGMGLDVSHDASGLTMAHEIGHMFGLFHVNCGSPAGIQYDYPYTTTDIGSIGINYALTRLILPTSASDVMSYCQPQHVSDFSYQHAQAYLEAHPPVPFASSAAARAAAAPRVQSFVVSGHISASGVWTIRQALPSVLPVEEVAEGEYTAEVLDAQGSSQSAALHFWQIDHSDHVTNRHFSISLPPINGYLIKIRHSGQIVFEMPLVP